MRTHTRHMHTCARTHIYKRARSGKLSVGVGGNLTPSNPTCLSVQASHLQYQGLTPSFSAWSLLATKSSLLNESGVIFFKVLIDTGRHLMNRMATTKHLPFLLPSFLTPSGSFPPLPAHPLSPLPLSISLWTSFPPPSLHCFPNLPPPFLLSFKSTIAPPDIPISSRSRSAPELVWGFPTENTVPLP